MVFGCISKNFPENIFWCLEKKKENTNPENHKPQPRKKSSTKPKPSKRNESNQAKETKTQQKKMNHRSWEKRELRSERCDRPNDERCNRPDDKRSHRRAMRSHQTKTRADERCDLIDRTAQSHCLDDRTVRSHRSRSSAQCDRPTSGAIDDRCSLIWALSSLTLSLIWALSSLSLFPKMNWSENESVNSFPGQRRKFWSTGIQFPENCIFRCNQTCGKGWKWFPEIIFTQNKRTLSVTRSWWQFGYWSHGGGSGSLGLWVLTRC